MALGVSPQDQCHSGATNLPLLISGDGAQRRPAIEPLMINSQILPCPQKRQKNKEQQEMLKVKLKSTFCFTS